MPADNNWDTVKLPMPGPDPKKKEPAAKPAAQPAKPAATAAAKPAAPAKSAASVPKLLDMAGMSATDGCKRFPPSDEALLLLKDGVLLVPFLNTLAKEKLFADAVQLLAHALPKREAVWWACRCARSIADTNRGKELFAALKAAEEWVANPTEEKRRVCETAAEATQYRSAAGLAALAAFFSGGSLAPTGVAAVEPGPLLTAKAVANAVQLAALGDPLQTEDRYLRFLSEGVRVVEGVSRWTDSQPAPSASR